MSKSQRIPIVAAPAAARTPLALPLRDLAVAPENLRFAEPPDDGIGELAETIFAAGLLQPLTVRPGGRRESAAMVLDGRRRLLALQALAAEGRIAPDHPVTAFVETDRGRQAAAVVLTNTAVPVHIADVIAAIGKMLGARLTPAAIAGALGYSELEVRRLAALSALHPKALEALKAGKVSLRQARLLARLPDRDAQGEIAEAALNGFGFQEWRVTERLDEGQVTVRDRRFALVGAARYAAAGGRLESDLFGERADVVLDPDRLQAAWTERAGDLAAALATALGDGLDGVEVRISVEPEDRADEALEVFGDGYGFGLDAEATAAWRAAMARVEEARDLLAGRDLSEGDGDRAITDFLAARLAAERAGEPPRPLTLVALHADPSTGLDLRAWGPQAPETEAEAEAASTDGEADGPDRGPAATPAPAAPLAAAPAPELEGVTHALHEVRTDTATRALVRALADNPAAALTAVVARLFTVVALRQRLARGDGALGLQAEPYGRPRAAPIAALDGEVRRRLAARREAWAASGLSPIAWVAGLPDAERLALLAELAALCLDLREERTSLVRRAARGEAVEIAALCGCDVTVHWTPDAAFLAAHPKARLLEMLEAMGEADPAAGGFRKDELVARVAERAAARRWAPAWLSWAAEPPDADEPPPEAA
jgi:ParB family chromosome partitioning protein